MIRALLFMAVCVALATGLVTFIFELPKLTADDKKIVWKVLLILGIAVVLFVGFAFMLQIDNHHSGVLP